MSKTIVPSTQITEDPKLALIKAFRVANKRAGEYARAGDNINYTRKLQHLGALQNQAEAEFDFHIWVNPNGNTGHTHTHDYRETRDSDNDYGAHLLIINAVDQEFAHGSNGEFPEEQNPSKFTDFEDQDRDWEDDQE